MADLNNLLDEITNQDEQDDNDDDTSPTHHDAPAVDPPVRSAIPAALEAALHQQQRNQSGSSNNDEDDINDTSASHLPDQEYEQLKSLYCQELIAPELLPADPDVVSLHVDLLDGQEETVQHLLRQSSSTNNTSDGDDVSGELASLMAQITKMDLDRTRYMLVDLARVRMAKMENFALFNWREMQDRLTEEESNYLKQYNTLLQKHYDRTVLQHLPKDAWKKLDEPEMIDSPNLEQFVFCRVLEPISIDLRNDGTNNNEDDDDDDDLIDTIQEHGEGACLIVMYKTVREFVLDGKVELLM